MRGTYENLAQPIDIGTVRLKNRIMKNGTGFFWDDPDTGSFMNDRYIAFFEALASGGAALVSSATGPLTRDVAAKMPGYKVLTDDYIPGWKRWADAVHQHDCLAFHQLFHLGPMTPLLVKAPPGVSSSSIPREESPRPGFGVPRASTVAEIEDVVDLFASAAERMKRAGLDGTEVNGACNHLINNFLSRAWNRRTDEYGCQTLENRTRLFVNVIREIKRRNGATWPVIALLNAQEVDLENGITLEESKQFAPVLRRGRGRRLGGAGRVLHLDQGRRPAREPALPRCLLLPGHEGPRTRTSTVRARAPGPTFPMAAEIKKVVAVPVISVGRLDWTIGEKAIGQGKIDIISLNRRLFADPELPNKVFEGRTEDINPCNSCMTCFDACEHFAPVQCRVNASLGGNASTRSRPAAQEEGTGHRRRPCGDGGCAGGGPAGSRGHPVREAAQARRLAPGRCHGQGARARTSSGLSTYLGAPGAQGRGGYSPGPRGHRSHRGGAEARRDPGGRRRRARHRRTSPVSTVERPHRETSSTAGSNNSCGSPAPPPCANWPRCP